MFEMFFKVLNCELMSCKEWVMCCMVSMEGKLFVLGFVFKVWRESVIV